MKFLKELFPYVITILIVLLIKTFIVTPVIVNGTSMSRTLHENDIMILNKISLKFSKPKRFEIVVIKHGDTKLIKRVIGLPGEKVEYKDNTLYINGKEINDKYNNGYTPEIEEIELSDDEYFVLGDNRGNSIDSSELGPFKLKQIIGKTKFTIWPLNRFGNK